MKNLLFTILLCTFSHGSMFSQTDENKTAAFQLSFLPPLSTNGIRSYQYTNRASFSLLAGVSMNEKAFAFAAFSNIILNDANGFQFAGISNYIGKDGKGVSFAGLINITKGNYTGFQFGGLMNIARRVSGVQFAGLLNIAESSRYPIGLVNIIKDGEIGIAISYNESGSTMVTFRSGGDVTYGIIGIGYNHKSNKKSYTTEGGLGARILCLPWLRINNELKMASISSTSESPTFIANYSLLPAFRLKRHIELFAGPSINYMNARKTENSDLFPKHSIWKKNGDTRLQRGYIGYQAGIQYVF